MFSKLCQQKLKSFFSKKIFYTSLVIISFLVLAANLFFNFFRNKPQFDILGSFSFEAENPENLNNGEFSNGLQNTEEIKKEIAYWESVVGKYGSFRDAYLKLAVLNYQIDNHKKSLSYLEKVFSLDPNNEIALELKKLLAN